MTLRLRSGRARIADFLIHWSGVLLIVVAVTCFAVAAFAQSGNHGHGHAEHHDWYQDLKQPGTGYSCCSGRRAPIRQTMARGRR
jgi:hypothetical protein